MGAKAFPFSMRISLSDTHFEFGQIDRHIQPFLIDRKNLTRSHPIYPIMGKKKKGGKKKGGGETLRGPPPEEECQTLEATHAAGSALYAVLEQGQLQKSAPTYVQVLYEKERVAKEEAENKNNAAKPAKAKGGKKKKKKKKK